MLQHDIVVDVAARREGEADAERDPRFPVRLRRLQYLCTPASPHFK